MSHPDHRSDRMEKSDEITEELPCRVRSHRRYPPGLCLIFRVDGVDVLSPPCGLP